MPEAKRISEYSQKTIGLIRKLKELLFPKQLIKEEKVSSGRDPIQSRKNGQMDRRMFLRIMGKAFATIAASSVAVVAGSKTVAEVTSSPEKAGLVPALSSELEKIILNQFFHNTDRVSFNIKWQGNEVIVNLRPTGGAYYLDENGTPTNPYRFSTDTNLTSYQNIPEYFRNRFNNITLEEVTEILSELEKNGQTLNSFVFDNAASWVERLIKRDQNRKEQHEEFSQIAREVIERVRNSVRLFTETGELPQEIPDYGAMQNLLANRDLLTDAPISESQDLITSGAVKIVFSRSSLSKGLQMFSDSEGTGQVQTLSGTDIPTRVKVNIERSGNLSLAYGSWLVVNANPAHGQVPSK